MKDKNKIDGLQYYSKDILFKRLGTVSLIRLMKLAYEEENRALIGCYFYYNPSNRLDNYLFRELKGSLEEYERDHLKKGTICNTLYLNLVEISNKSNDRTNKKIELVKEIRMFIEFYSVNLSYFCEANHLPYQVVYRTVMKDELHKMSVEKLENLKEIFEKEFHK